MHVSWVTKKYHGHRTGMAFMRFCIDLPSCGEAVAGDWTPSLNAVKMLDIHRNAPMNDKP